MSSGRNRQGGHERSREAGSGTTGQSPHGKEEGGRPSAAGVGQEEASQGSRESGKHGDGRGAERTAGNIGWEKDYGELDAAIRMRNYSCKTLTVCHMWVRKFRGFVRNKPVQELDSGDVKAFLSDLAVRRPCEATCSGISWIRRSTPEEIVSRGVD
ncbi:MAG TPA: phage integrase N-terminal SAM-like domain-containing protein [Verrucomicrobiales bacterium]|nr:phage integrase N-terminal SAM-like domain-containing protein [Verrucomicrobiales bacterium]